MTAQTAIQDQIPHNHCYGCGTQNPKGLQIKSYWRDSTITECRFQPQAHHSAGPLNYLNGGIIATVIDCHAICTAMAKAYRDEGREIGEGDLIWFVTGKLDINYLAPTIIAEEMLVIAELLEVAEKKMVLGCELLSQDKKCAVAEVIAVRVPSDWA